MRALSRPSFVPSLGAASAAVRSAAARWAPWLILAVGFAALTAGAWDLVRAAGLLLLGVLLVVLAISIAAYRGALVGRARPPR